MLDKTSFPYGAGFRSLTRETPEPISLAVQGELPTWLEGTLLRTGPSKFEVGMRTYNHWFDGLAMLHRFAFAGGRLHRDVDADALQPRDAPDARRVRLRRGAERSGLDRAPALRRGQSLPLQLHRRFPVSYTHLTLPTIYSV